MKNFKKRSASCLGSLIKWILILVLLLVLCVYFLSGKVLDFGIKGVGSFVGLEMGSSTKIDFFFLGANVDMQNFYIKNPKGFNEGDGISFKQVVFKMAPTMGAIDGSAPAIIDEITIIAPKLVMETSGLSTNLGTIKDKFTNALPKSNKASQPVQTEEKPPRKFIIKKIVFTDGEIKGSATGIGGITAPLPSFAIENLGVKENGLTALELSSVIFVEVINQAISAFGKGTLNGGKFLLDETGKASKDALKSTTDAAKDTVNAVQNLFK